MNIDENMFSPNRMLSTIFLSFSLSILLCEGISYPKPHNCGIYECPSYEVVYSQKEFEIRNYTSATWLSTKDIVSKSFNDATVQGFRKVFSYITGKNKEGKRIKMTAPVLVNVVPPTDSNSDSKLVVYYYVPQEFQKKPPVSDELLPLNLPTNKLVAVRRFGGFVNDSIIGPNSEVNTLRNSLEGTTYQGKYNSSSFSVAIYNAPFEIINRVNEILLSFVD
ncbi:hypothetical protein LIER_34294 [Lithospermum erythrorhizon]|uniref:Uncharacterized protein n=1 Tax=Lithospermum erythrorhizon TaxID=34254 RepID=A0AAV3S3G1_LITER